MVEFDSDLIGQALDAHNAAHELGPEYVSFLQQVENGTYQPAGWTSPADMMVDSTYAYHAAHAIGSEAVCEFEIAEDVK